MIRLLLCVSGLLILIGNVCAIYEEEWEAYKVGYIFSRGGPLCCAYHWLSIVADSLQQKVRQATGEREETSVHSDSRDDRVAQQQRLSVQDGSQHLLRHGTNHSGTVT